MLFSSAFPAMFGTFVKYQFQRTYDAILAAPVDTEELVTAEALWIATRAGVYGCVPMLVAIAFGLDPSWGMLTVPLIAWISGFGWACFGIMIAGFAKSIENFNYVVSAVLTPLFLVAGTFFPISNLPRLGAVPRRAQPAPPLRRARPPRRVRLPGLGPRPASARSPLRPDRVARRDPRDDAQADRLESSAWAGLASRCVALVVGGRELQEECVEARALLRVEGGEELIFDTRRDLTQPRQRLPALGGQADEVPSPVPGSRRRSIESGCLELVEEPDQVAAVVPQRVGDRRLRLPRVLAQE